MLKQATAPANYSNVQYPQSYILQIAYYSTPSLCRIVFTSNGCQLLRFVNCIFVYKMVGFCVHVYCTKNVKIFLA